MMCILRYTPVAMLAALLLALAGIAAAQHVEAEATGSDPVPAAEHTPDGQDALPARELLEQVLFARLSRELKLTEEETVLMVRRYAEFREEMLDLRTERERVARQLRQAVKDNSDEAVLTPLLAEIRRVDEKMANARMTIYDEISAELDTRQKARLYLFIGEFEAQLRRWLNEARQRRAGGDWLPPGRGDNPRPLPPLRRGPKAPPPPPAP